MGLNIRCTVRVVINSIFLNLTGRILVIALIIVLHAGYAHAQYQQTSITYLSLNEGLSQGNVKCILKDKMGYIWFATDDGLNKYNGYKITVYKHDINNSKSLKSSNIETIFEDRTGDLWIGTGNGLSLYDRRIDGFININADKYDIKTLSNDDILSFYQDEKENIWIGTYSGLNLLDRKTLKFKRFFYKKDEDNVDEHHINALAGDGHGNLFLGTQGGLIKFNVETGNYIRFTHKEDDARSIGSDNIHSLLKTVEGVFVATDKGLDEFDQKN